MVLIFTLVINIGLRVLLLKARLPTWLSFLSWITLILRILSALYIEVLFLRLMTPAFNRQIALGLLIIGGIGALAFADLGNSDAKIMRRNPPYHEHDVFLMGAAPPLRKQG
jgi:hypothetical protein